MIKKTKTGYAVDIRPLGRDGRRFRKSFKTQGEARAYKHWVVKNYSDEKEWLEKIHKDHRTILDLIKIWYQSHGINNKYGKGTHQKLIAIANSLNNPLGCELTATDYIKYRTDRLLVVSKNTVNHELAYLKGVFNYLIKIDEIKYANPVGKISKLKTDDQELHFLSVLLKVWIGICQKDN